MKSGCRGAKNTYAKLFGNDKRKMNKMTKMTTRPLNTNEENEYITINYSTNTLKYIPHARRTNIHNPKGQNTKDTNEWAFSSLK